jgi:tetratricopeptide (TPR) repeat protein
LNSFRRFAAVALAIAAGVAAIYGQTFRHGFLSVDDATYILYNPAVSRGLSWQGVLWAFGFHASNWHPLTWVSHMLDVELFGVRAGAHHIVSAGLHVANAVLLLGVLAAMTGAFWRSAAVAAIFALHPQRVESVAWAAERKDVLSALLGLLAIGAYLGYARRPGAGRYLLALGLFALGLAAKPMLVTLPFVLLLLDWWPLGRALAPAPTGASPAAVAGRSALRLLIEKAPFLALSLLSCLVTLRAQTLDVLPMVTPDLATRLTNAGLSSLRYLGTFFWPADLAFYYPYPRTSLLLGAAATAALVLIGAVAVLRGRRRPYFAVGWAWYVGTLVPVIGLVQVGGQGRADRYTYLPMVGVSMAAVWLAGEFWPRRAPASRALAAASVFALVALSATAAAYARIWRDDLTLLEHTVRATRDNYLMLNNLGTALIARGSAAEAVAALQQAVRIKPDHCNARYNLGRAFMAAGQDADALDPLYLALQCYERSGEEVYIADASYNLGLAYSRLGRLTEAEWHLRTLLRNVPDYPGARDALAEVLARKTPDQGGPQGRR